MSRSATYLAIPAAFVAFFGASRGRIIMISTTKPGVTVGKVAD